MKLVIDGKFPLGISVLFAFFLCCVRLGVAQQGPVVAISGGSIRGTTLPDGGVVFKGIPYAQPPLAELRWKAPLPAKSWTGVKNTVEFGGECAQNPMWGHPKVVNEDYLYVSVWTPALPPTPLRPVMVWIHGGGNVAGSGNENGESLMRHGVVLVTMNYRLALFGFFAHPELTTETPDHTAGNYGLMDQIAALQWVQENIKKFGGDPANVTIFGESAGAMDVNLLMASPLAKGLFQKVIAESGSVLLDRGAVPLKVAEEFGEKLVAAANLPAGADTLKALRAAPVEQLLAAFAKVVPPFGVPLGLGVNIDGKVLPQSPALVFAQGKQLPAALIIGINAREIGGASSAADVAKNIETAYGTLAPQALPLYGITPSADGKFAQGAPDPLYGDAGAQWMTDITFRCPSTVVASLNSRSGQPTYQYQFSRGIPGRLDIGATHASEVIYVFGNLDDKRPMRPDYDAADYAISKAMQEYWTNFAKNGTPDSKGLPAWPAYTADTRQYMEFTDKGPVAGSHLRGEQCKVFAESLRKRAEVADSAH